MPLLLLAKKYWYLIVIALLLGSAVHLSNKAEHWHDQTELSEQSRKTDKANFEAAALKASDDNKKTVLETEHKWQEVAAEKDKTYNAKIAVANASIADYVSRMRLQPNYSTASSGFSRSGVPSPAQPSGITDGTREGTIVPVPENDLYICAENTVKAQTWQTFYSGLLVTQPKETP